MGKRWTYKHRQVCRLRVLGLTQADIARRVGLSLRDVVYVLAWPEAKEYIARLEREIDLATVELAAAAQYLRALQSK